MATTADAGLQTDTSWLSETQPCRDAINRVSTAFPLYNTFFQQILYMYDT